MANFWANSMACHSGATLCDVSHCSVVPLGEFTVMIPEPHATLHNVIIPSATELLKILFRHILFCFFNAVWALTSGGFRIVSDTLVRTSLYVTKLSILITWLWLVQWNFLRLIFINFLRVYVLVFEHIHFCHAHKTVGLKVMQMISACKPCRKAR